MRSVKIRIGSPMEVSDFRRMAAFSNIQPPTDYTISSPDFYERGIMVDGVTYPDGGQPDRTLHLLVPDKPKPPVKQRESYIDEDGIYHFSISI